MSPNDWIAIYAAIVATGALLLELRRWVESGPRIAVSATPNMVIFSAHEVQEEGLLVVRAYNRGELPTTVTHMVICRFTSRWNRWRGKHAGYWAITHPQPKGAAPIIPKVIEPGGHWTGFGRPRPDILPDIETGEYWAGVITTARNRPFLARIPKRREAPSPKKAD